MKKHGLNHLRKLSSCWIFGRITFGIQVGNLSRSSQLKAVVRCAFHYSTAIKFLLSPILPYVFFFLINLFKQLIISYVCSASSIFYIDVPVQEIIDEEDEKLKALKSEYGYKVYVAVTNALTEINKYKPISRYENKELWNHREGRKATLREVVSHMLEQWRLYAQKRY